MGCVYSVFRAKTTTDVITELRQLDMSLREMVYKYEIQLDRTNAELKQKVSDKAPKDRLMILLRRRKILLGYLGQCENRLTVCTQKQCSLEQLEITRMQLNAIKSTGRIFKRFTKKHTVERVELLQESLCALQDDMMDISDILDQPVIDDVDVDDELEELMRVSEVSEVSKVSEVSNVSEPGVSMEGTLEFPQVPEVHMPEIRITAI